MKEIQFDKNDIAQHEAMVDGEMQPIFTAHQTGMYQVYMNAGDQVVRMKLLETKEN